MVWLFEGGVAEGECVAHGCFDGYAEQVADPADVAAGGRRSLEGCGLREGLVVRGWCCARGIAPTGWAGRAFAGEEQVSVDAARSGRGSVVEAGSQRAIWSRRSATLRSLRPSENFPPIGMIRCARGLLLCTVRPGPPAGNLPVLKSAQRRIDRSLMFRRGRQLACEPWVCSSKGGETSAHRLCRLVHLRRVLPVSGRRPRQH